MHQYKYDCMCFCVSFNRYVAGLIGYPTHRERERGGSETEREGGKMRCKMTCDIVADEVHGEALC